jgi:hypothetical protein
MIRRFALMAAAAMALLGSVQNLSHIFSSDGGFGWVFLGLKQWPHVHVPFR